MSPQRPRRRRRPTRGPRRSDRLTRLAALARLLGRRPPAAQPTAPAASRLRVMSRNVHLGSASPSQTTSTIAALARKYRPDVISLQETALASPAIMAWAASVGWTVVGERGVPRGPGAVDEHGDTLLLLAPHVRVVRRAIAVMRTAWVVQSHDREHRPRRYPRAVIEVRGQRWKVSAAHWPTPFGRNWPAFVESSARCYAALAVAGTTPALEVGDLNWHRAVPRPAGVRLFLRGVDGALTRRCTVAQAWNLGHLGSDHPSWLMDVAADTATAGDTLSDLVAGAQVSAR